MEKYISHQINKFKNLSNADRVYRLNEIYAVLEERGNKRADIKKAINKVIKQNIKNLLEDIYDG